MKMTEKSYLATSWNRVLPLIVEFLCDFLPSLFAYSFIYVHERSAFVTWSTDKTGFQLVVES